VKYHDFGFSLAFAVTFHKIQGKTANKLILDLNQNSQVPITLPTLYVGISRVRHSRDLRLLPPLSSSTIAWPHLRNLKHNNHYLQWSKSYNDGIFSFSPAPQFATNIQTKSGKTSKKPSSNLHNDNANDVHILPCSKLSSHPVTITKQTAHKTLTKQPSLFTNQTLTQLLLLDQLDVVLQVDIQLYLRLNNLTVIPAQPDGHCLIHAWSISTGQSLSYIKDIIANEYTLNKHFYSSFGITELDLSSYLSDRQYSLQSVDAVINILCNATNTTAAIIGQQYVYTQDLHDNTVTHFQPVSNTTEFRQIKPISGLTTDTIFLLKTASHYDAIILPRQPMSASSSVVP
jgi:hypothetical protein